MTIENAMIYIINSDKKGNPIFKGFQMIELVAFFD